MIITNVEENLGLAALKVWTAFALVLAAVIVVCRFALKKY
jgi:hypothetical protein